MAGAGAAVAHADRQQGSDPCGVFRHAWERVEMESHFIRVLETPAVIDVNYFCRQK